MSNLDSFPQTDIQRRKFMEWIGLSSLALALPIISLSGCHTIPDKVEEIPDFKNVFDLEALSQKRELKWRSTFSRGSWSVTCNLQERPQLIKSRETL